MGTHEQVVALIDEHGLPERTFDALYEAAFGLKVRRQRSMASGIDQRTATRDLGLLTSRPLLEPHGQGPGRYHQAIQSLWELVRPLRRAISPIVDPYPGPRRLIEAARRG